MLAESELCGRVCVFRVLTCFSSVDDPQHDIFAPLRALAGGEHRSAQLWLLLAVAFVTWAWLWPAISRWLARHSEKRVADHADEIRAARLKQADALRAAVAMQRDVVEKPRKETKPPLSSQAPPRPPVTATFMQPGPRQERRAPRFGRLPPGAPSS